MQNLILATIAIALGVIAVGLTTYYGGNALLGAREDAEAVRLFADAEQVAGALWQWRFDEMADLPDSTMDVQTLVDSGHMRGIPASDWLEKSFRGSGAVSGWQITSSYVAAPLGNLTDASTEGAYALDVCLAARKQRGFEPTGPVPGASAFATTQDYYDALVAVNAVLSCGSGDPATDTPEYGTSVASPRDPCCVCTRGAGALDTTANPICE